MIFPFIIMVDFVANFFFIIIFIYSAILRFILD